MDARTAYMVMVWLVLLSVLAGVGAAYHLILLQQAVTGTTLLGLCIVLSPITPIPDKQRLIAVAVFSVAVAAAFSAQ